MRGRRGTAAAAAAAVARVYNAAATELGNLVEIAARTVVGRRRAGLGREQRVWITKLRAQKAQVTKQSNQQAHALRYVPVRCAGGRALQFISPNSAALSGRRRRKAIKTDPGLRSNSYLSRPFG